MPTYVSGVAWDLDKFFEKHKYKNKTLKENEYQIKTQNAALTVDVSALHYSDYHFFIFFLALPTLAFYMKLIFWRTPRLKDTVKIRATQEWTQGWELPIIKVPGHF